MEKKTIVSIVISIITMIVLIASASYAYFTASITGGSNIIKGSAYSFEVDLELNILKKSTHLVPILNNNVTNTLSGVNICIKGGYEVCSMYELVLTNASEETKLYSYIITDSSTYTTNNLKAALYTYNGTSYTLATDITTLSHGANAISNFNLNSQKYMTTLANGKINASEQKYYLVVWISETNNNQSVDENKYFNGSIVFESINGDKLTSTFS